MDKLAPLTWAAVCENRNLRNLPYKIETNGYGQIIMSPTNYRHGRRQFKIGQRLALLLRGGESAIETAVQTSQGVKVADVTWAPHAFIARHDEALDLPEAPPICVEVISPTNTKGEITGTKGEITGKRELYFERGAREVWVCDLEGKITFYNPDGPLERSAICPKFPAQVKL